MRSSNLVQQWPQTFICSNYCVWPMHWKKNRQNRRIHTTRSFPSTIMQGRMSQKWFTSHRIDCQDEELFRRRIRLLPPGKIVWDSKMLCIWAPIESKIRRNIPWIEKNIQLLYCRSTWLNEAGKGKTKLSEIKLTYISFTNKKEQRTRHVMCKFYIFCSLLYGV